MKRIFYCFLLLFLIISLKSNIAKSEDLSCLNHVLNKLFAKNVTELCTNGSTADLNSFSYSTVCNNQTNNLMDVSITNFKFNGIDSLKYDDLNCFSLNSLSLIGLSISVDAFGTENQKAISKNIVLNNCTFPDGRFTSIGNTLSYNTSFFTNTIYDGSNLLNIDFYSIKFLTNCFLNSVAFTHPIYSNSLQPSDKNNLKNMDISIGNIPSFANLVVATLSLKIIGTSFSSTEISNMGTLQGVSFLSLSSSSEIEYMDSISNNNNILFLSILSPFTANPKGYSLPPYLQSFQIVYNPNFNINGKFPFVGSLPNSLKTISIGGPCITTFPNNIPPNIEVINFGLNSFDSNLPDLSSLPKLRFVSFISCGFTGPIPDSYCLFETILNTNNLTGYLPQCKACFPNSYNDSFSGNPLLLQATCQPGSIVPNLEYNYSTGSLILYGENLGLDLPKIVEVQLFFFIVSRNSKFQLYWDQTKLGDIPDTLDIQLSGIAPIYTLATKYLKPIIKTITKSGNDYTFKGINFSYNTNDFIIKVSGVECVISYSEFTLINCTLGQTVLGNQIQGTIQNKRSSEIVPFLINTIDNTTTPVFECITDCNEPLGYGICNTTVGVCACSQYYTYSDCSLPNQYVSSVSSVPTTGGVVSVWGWFGLLNTTQISIKIGQQICSVISVNSTFINCTLGPGRGTHSIVIVQNGITYTGNNMFHYTELTYSCPKDCSNNGKCNISSGQCTCFSGWGGYDCNSKANIEPSTTTTSSSGSTQTPIPEVEIPKSNTTVNGTDGSTVISNQQTTYEISILSLLETDYSNNIINSYNLSKKWSPVNVTSNNIYKFTQIIQESCTITFTIEEIKTARDYQWAGLDLTLDKDSIKISVSIKNYTFNSVLNNLQLRFKSLVGDSNANTQENNECNNKDTEVDTSEIDKNQLLNYVTISRNQKILYGRFINRVISDSRQTFITTSIIPNNNNNDKQSVIIGLNLPHCINECLIDPDFSVLVSSSYQKCSNKDNSGRASWVLPVAIVVPCVAVVAIIIVSVILYKKNRLVFLLVKSKVKGLKLGGIPDKN
ncbi:hypothetical protein RB653_001419 [Dictyostelium firmibasis]|uniref:EGF-like domain-containing protein n=1 Tax=Dictyostelium firmibasis TaxID=79012 RepID=A0AAN7TYI4_9MYCE